MEVSRGEVWWVDLPDPVASAPGGTRPVLVVQSNAFNRSAIRTVVVAVITSNLRLADAPGNVPIGAKEAGLSKPSVVNVSQLLTLDRSFLRSKSGRLKPATLEAVDRGLHLVLSLAER
jgi:mRNA interferase MazF